MRPIYQDLICITGLFEAINFQHIFRERNALVDQLPKNGLQVGDGVQQQWEQVNETISEHDPKPHFG